MRLELSVKADYLPKWGFWAGCRELIQNGRDAEVQFDAPLTVDHYNNKLRIENGGVTLPHEALLFGHTTKQNDNRTIGKFGEGLSLGVLALVRSGYPVKIRSGSEVWNAAIERSEKYDADVLVFHISKGRDDKNRVRIEIDNITKDDWEAIKPLFLFLNKHKPNDTVETKTGDLLLSNIYKKKVFVKGIYVYNNTDLNYGYNLLECGLDRDRNLIDSYDLKSGIRKIWQDAVVTRPDLIDPFFELLNQERAEDVDGINEYNAYDLPNVIKKTAVKKFKDQFGEDSFPVENLEQCRELEHLGKRGVIVARPLRVVLQETFGDVDKVKDQLKTEVLTKYSWSDLSKLEQDSLVEAIELINVGSILSLKTEAVLVTLSDIDIVDFRSSTMLGQFDSATNRVSIAKKLLEVPGEPLETLIHEVSHKVTGGDDGEKGHGFTIERIWSGIVQHLKGK